MPYLPSIYIFLRPHIKICVFILHADGNKMCSVPATTTTSNLRQSSCVNIEWVKSHTRTLFATYNHSQPSTAIVDTNTLVYNCISHMAAGRHAKMLAIMATKAVCHTAYSIARRLEVCSLYTQNEAAKMKQLNDKRYSTEIKVGNGKACTMHIFDWAKTAWKSTLMCADFFSNS